MVLLGSLMTWLVGNGFKIVTLPVLIIGMLHMGGNVLEARRNELRREGAQACLSKTQMASFKAELMRAQRDVAVEADIRKATEDALTEVRARARQLEDEINVYRNKPVPQPQPVASRDAAPASDDRCISDWVRELATGDGRAKGR